MNALLRESRLSRLNAQSLTAQHGSDAAQRVDDAVTDAHVAAIELLELERNLVAPQAARQDPMAKVEEPLVAGAGSQTTGKRRTCGSPRGLSRKQRLSTTTWLRACRSGMAGMFSSTISFACRVV